MPIEFDNSLHWGFFLTGTTLTSDTGKYVRVSELVLAALRAAGVFSNMVDDIVAPATDKLWLDKNFDPAVLKEWDATGASWVPMTYGRLFGRAAVDKLTVTGGTGNAVVVSQPAGFQAARLYLMTPTADNGGAATINVSGVGTFAVKYGDGSDIGATEFKAGRQAALFFTGARFEVLFPLNELSSAVVAAQASAAAALASEGAAAGSEAASAASAGLALEFATNPEDSPITGFPALRSALHWAAKAASYVAGNIGLAIHAFANKTPPTGADELVIADSADIWNGKRLSLTNLAAWLADLPQTLTDKTLDDSTTQIRSTAAPTKLLKLSASLIALGVTRTATFPDEDFTVGNAASERGYAHGLTLANNVADATNDIDIAVGAAASDDATPTLLRLGAALTKRLDANWAVGTNQGGLDTGAVANDTYHVWLIRRPDTGVVDVLFSLSATAPTMPVSHATTFPSRRDKWMALSLMPWNEG